VELTRLEHWERSQDCRHELLEVRHTVRWRTDKEHTDGRGDQILLELDAAVHRHQRVILAFHTPQKLAIGDTRPATPGHRIHTVAPESSGEV
jgi:hypothetical protein